MWANAQRHGRPAVAPSVQRRKVWLTPNTGVSCGNADKTRKPLKLAGVPQTGKPISAASGPKFTILWGHLEDILLLNKSFSIVDTGLSCEDIAGQSCAMVPRRRFLATFCVLYFQRAAYSTFQTCTNLRLHAEINRGKKIEEE